MRFLYFPILIVLLCTLKLAQSRKFVSYGGGRYVYTKTGEEGKYIVEWFLEDQRRSESTYPLQTANGDRYNGVKGSYSYSLGGKDFRVSFKADANGYQPKVDLFKPTPPRIPPLGGAIELKPINKDALVAIGGSRSG